MEWLEDWLKQIILLILIATFIDLLLPNRSMERYVKLVMGLLMIMAILAPILKFIGKEKELSALAFDQQVKGEEKSLPSMQEIESSSQQIEKQQDAFVRQRARRQMEQMVAEQVEARFDVDVRNCIVQLKEEASTLRLERIRLTVSPASSAPKGQGIPAMEPVEPVEIGERTEAENKGSSERHEKWTQPISRHVAETWHMDPAAVEIRVEP